jgi:hypothetical protein
VRRELVLHAVPRDERDAVRADRADDRRRRGVAVGGVDLDGLRVVQERVEPGAAEHPDLRFGHEDEGSFAVPVFEPVPVSEPFDDDPASEPFDDDPPSEVEDPDEAPDEDPEAESEDEEDEPPSESFFDPDPVLAGARLSVA